MPQMSPLNWILLLLFFSIIFIMINMINYFIMKYQNKNIKTLSKKEMNFWKW
uniref:ATP synthase complex subunit 8 n=1 Tax=Malachiinae sp. GENSP01 TaxID=1205562 RepID=A0A0S2MQG5_9CUCU|nr:ATP synthase F0 subunit 8 [Malachiinae sp. GENSP01]